MNIAKPVVKTAKYHLITVLTTLNWSCPIKLWRRTVKKIEDILNMFRTSRNNTTKTAYQETEGAFNWNATPLAPVRTRAMVFIHPDNHSTFAPHCDTGHVVGRAPRHYCLLEFYIPAMRGYKCSGMYRLYPQRFHMPTTSTLEADRTAEAAAYLAKESKKNCQR